MIERAWILFVLATSFFYQKMSSECFPLESSAQPCNINLTSPMNGSLVCNSTVQVTYTQCNVTCDTGFELVGSGNRNCQPNGWWSGEQAYCQLRRCSILFPPSNAFIQLPCSPLYGSECTVRCFEGYEIAANSSNTEYCWLNEDGSLSWTHNANCTDKERSPCNIETCKHGGKCSETEDGQDFICDCTGTLYQGRRCERGLIQIAGINYNELELPSSVSKTVTTTMSASPDNDLTVDFKRCFILIPGAAVTISPCKNIKFTKNEKVRTLTIRIPPRPTPGIYTFPVKTPLKGSNSEDFEHPPPIVLVVRGSSAETPYLDRFGYQLISGCCTPPISRGTRDESSSVGLSCPSKFGGQSIDFRSSCKWTSIDSDIIETAGIVFSSFQSFLLPISVTGLSVNQKTGDTQPSERNTCGGCSSGRGKEISADVTFDSLGESVCYIHRSTPDEVAEFLSKQTLADSFLSTVSNELLPTWLQLGVKSNSDNSFKIEQSDLFLSIEKEVNVRNSFCSNMILDSEGHFALLTYKGKLDLKLQSLKNVSENYTLTAPTAGSYYCIAVNLCLAKFSPVYIGIPSSAQESLKNISLISDYVNRGWKITFVSLIFRRNVASLPRNIPSHWNGFTLNYHPKDSFVNVVASLQVSAHFVHGQTTVGIDYDGEVRYQYSTSKEVVAEANGIHTVTITTLVYGKKEQLILNSLFTSAFIYHNDKTFTCNEEETNGIAWKLDYSPRQDQKFFLGLLSLPYDTAACRVQLFLNLDSNKEMDGLSFYSSCLDILYDQLLFAGDEFEHYFYLISNTSTLCTNSSLPDSQDFGLLVQSSVSSSVPLGKFFMILPGPKAVEMKYSASSQSKTGLIQSVDVSILGISDNTALVLRDSFLSFSITGNMFMDNLYKASITGTAFTTSPWDIIRINITGYFSGDFPGRINMAVHKHLMQISKTAKDRRDEAEGMIKEMTERFEFARLEFENSKSLAEISSKEYDDAVTSETEATMNLMKAEKELSNAIVNLKNSEMTSKDLCQEEACKLICDPEDITSKHKNSLYETGECYSSCTKVENVSLAHFINNDSTVLPVKYYNIQITTTCKVPCTVLVNNKTVECRFSKTDNGGDYVGGTNCTISNSICKSTEEVDDPEQAKQKEKKIVDLIMIKNKAQEALNLAKNNTIKARISRDIALQNLMNSQIALAQIEEKKNTSLADYSVVVKENCQGLKVYDQMKTEPMSEIFNVTKLTFSINIELLTPVRIPIDIEFSSSTTDSRSIGVTYDFSTVFSAQQLSLSKIVADYIFSPTNCQTENILKRLKRQIDKKSFGVDSSPLACPVEGQVYQDCKTCPVTCSEPDISCPHQCVAGCGCPEGQVIDEVLNKCVNTTECPESNPCTLPVDKGDCLGRILRYYFNSVTQSCEQFYWGGCGGNENKFNYLHDCEKQCSVCPPTCTPSFCLTNRKATCSVSGKPSDYSCPSGCVISNCKACYYSYTPLSLPKLDSSCPTSCISAGEINDDCLIKWGKCAHRGFLRAYPKIPMSARTASNYHCWNHPCTSKAESLL